VKLSDEQVRRLHAAGESIDAMATEFGVTNFTAWHVSRVRARRHLKISDAQVQLLRERHAAGEDLSALAAEYGIKFSYAWQVATGARRKHAGGPTLLDAFEGRRQLIAYYFMWNTGRPAAEQCEGCTWYTSQIGELSYLHHAKVTYATFCQGPLEESVRYRDFMGWTMPWYSALGSLDGRTRPRAGPNGKSWRRFARTAVPPPIGHA
jgi:predicted dithiol-disulfide oxidoreductase (DUF899 family)